MSPRLQLGDFQLTIVSDGNYYLDGGVLFSVVPKPLWSKRMPPDELNRIAVGENSVIVRTGKKTVLIETGIGNKLNDKLKKIFDPREKLLENLAAAGVRPEQIDVVINSHLHFDHCGWNTIRKEGKIVPTFPNAKYYAPRGEWEVGREQRDRARIRYMSENYDPLIESGQMQLLSGGETILPGISVRNYPGHTRAMQAIILESGGKTACYISDLIPTTRHLEPTWMTAFDLYPLETIESKKKYYAESIPGRWLTIFTHEPDIPWACIEHDEKGNLVARPPE